MSIYVEKIEQLALSNKYTKWYTNICKNAIKRCDNRKDAKELLGYVEGHHILPISFNLGGEKDKANFAFLTAREHFIIHLLATKMFSNNFKYKMQYAFRMLFTTRDNIKTTSIQYDYYKKLNPQLGKKHTKESIQKIKDNSTSWKRKGIVLTPEQKELFGHNDPTRKKMMSELHSNRIRIPHTEETKQKMRKPKSEQGKLNMRGVPKPNAQGKPRPRKSGYKRINGKHVYPTDINNTNGQ